MINCKNCNTAFKGKFCNNCGQAADTEKINYKFIVSEFKKTFIRFDAGFLYTTKYLFKNPGKAINGFIEGKRIHHIRPFTYLIVITGIYILLYNFLHLHLFQIESSGKESDNIGNIIIKYFTEIQFLFMLIATVFSALFFGLKKYNFFEYIIIHTYLTSQRILISSVSLPLLYFIKSANDIRIANNFLYLLGVLLMTWTFLYLFKDDKKWLVVLKVLGLQVLIFLVLGSALYSAFFVKY